MTTSELIAHLSKLPSDAKVMLWGPKDETRDLETAEAIKLNSKNGGEKIVVLLS